MIKKSFDHVALVGGKKLSAHKNYFTKLVKFLRTQKKEILLEKTVAKILEVRTTTTSQLKQADLILVFGGDGALLGAVRDLFGSTAAFAGIRLDGTLGFLTEYSPENLEKLLIKFFVGKFEIGERILLETKIYRDKKIVKTLRALNEVVIHQKGSAELIELDFSLDTKKIATFHIKVNSF